MEEILKLDEGDKKITNWFDRLEWLDDEFILLEKNDVLCKLNDEVDDEGETWKSDLKWEEFQDVWQYVSKKMEICKKYLEDHPDKNKQEVIISFNSVFSDLKSDDSNKSKKLYELANLVTNDLITEKINNKSEA